MLLNYKRLTMACLAKEEEEQKRKEYKRKRKTERKKNETNLTLRATFFPLL